MVFLQEKVGYGSEKHKRNRIEPELIDGIYKASHKRFVHTHVEEKTHIIRKEVAQMGKCVATVAKLHKICHYISA